MSKDYQIAMLWMAGPLSYLEQLCIVSFQSAGHHVKLYHYDEIFNVPDGVELADANEVLPQTNFLKHERTGSPALHSDLFRYHMLNMSQDTIWADTDAYCVKRFETPNGHFYGWESKKHINGGVLGLPAGSDTLNALMEFTTDEFAIPSYYGPEYQAELEEAKANGTPVHAGEQPWGVWGPHAVTHFLHETGEARFALPQHGLYPFTFKDRRLMLKKNFDTSPYINDETYSIHLYGRRMRRRLIGEKGGVPHPDSLLGNLIRLHGLDPSAAPIPDKKPAYLQQEGVSEGAILPKTVLEAVQDKRSGPASLPELAATGGLADQGFVKYKVADIVQGYLGPLRGSKFNMAEIGAPYLADGADGYDTLSIFGRFLPKATITSIGANDDNDLDDPRVVAVDCELETLDSVAAITPDLPEFKLIFDHGFQASSHQQARFISLFSKLKSGGLYVIEGLRWQPKSHEISGFTKTADLFKSVQSGSAIRHSDRSFQAAFDKLRPQITQAMVYQVGLDAGKRDHVAVIQKR